MAGIVDRLHVGLNVNFHSFTKRNRSAEVVVSSQMKNANELKQKQYTINVHVNDVMKDLRG